LNEPSLDRLVSEIPGRIDALALLEELFDCFPDIVFFVKDAQGRYVRVNHTLVERCGRRSKGELLGRTSADLFPAPLGESFLRQDLRVVRSGKAIRDRLELHLYRDGREGWCLTNKFALRNAAGRHAGTVGFSRDLRSVDESAEDYAPIARAVMYVQEHLDERIRVDDLAAITGLSGYQMDRRFRRIFGIGTRQFLGKSRIDLALGLLRESEHSIAEIAARCGYADQSAFTRHFKGTVGMTPRQYRRNHEFGA
jgi:PAS domain S-box-containing protein